MWESRKTKIWIPASRKSPFSEFCGEVGSARLKDKVHSVFQKTAKQPECHVEELIGTDQEWGGGRFTGKGLKWGQES